VKLDERKQRIGGLRLETVEHGSAMPNGGWGRNRNRLGGIPAAAPASPSCYLIDPKGWLLLSER
jgi:hypothetical protein